MKISWYIKAAIFLYIAAVMSYIISWINQYIASLMLIGVIILFLGLVLLGFINGLIIIIKVNVLKKK